MSNKNLELKVNKDGLVVLNHKRAMKKISEFIDGMSDEELREVERILDEYIEKYNVKWEEK